MLILKRWLWLCSVASLYSSTLFIDHQPLGFEAIGRRAHYYSSYSLFLKTAKYFEIDKVECFEDRSMHLDGKNGVQMGHFQFVVQQEQQEEHELRRRRLRQPPSGSLSPPPAVTQCSNQLLPYLTTMLSQTWVLQGFLGQPKLGDLSQWQQGESP